MTFACMAGSQRRRIGWGFIAAACLEVSVGCAAPRRIALSELDIGPLKQGWGAPGVNRSVEQHPLTIGGREFSSGVGTHADSELHLKLDGRTERFTAQVGVDDETDSKGSIRFRIYGDSRRLFDSGPMVGGANACPVDVPLKGVRHLVLLVSSMEDGIDWDHADWADAAFQVSGASPRTIPVPREEAEILTPVPGPAPRLNNCLVYGARPGHPVVYRIPATGERPMTFAADNLPATLHLDAGSGIITGTAPAAAGDYVIQLRAANAHGREAREFKLVVGDTLALTPPMGWNSWYMFYNHVTDAAMRDAANAMVASGMADFGYAYVNIDDCWAIQANSTDPELSGAPRDAAGNIRPNARFPDMRALTDFIHSLGLKTGIYTSPGPTTCAGFTASAGHEEQDARQFAAWGFDFLKYDWCSYGGRDPSIGQAGFKAPYQQMGDILKTLDRDMVFNLCQYGMGQVWEWGAATGGNCWRTTDDLGNEGGSLTGGIYKVGLFNATLADWSKPGAWNDPDYLLVGIIGDGAGGGRPSTLTPNEQYTHMSLWCLMAAPLFFSGDLTKLDPFTLNILCNAEVIAVDQDPLGRAARIVARDDEHLVMAKPLADGSLAVGLFNLSVVPQEVGATWSELGCARPKQVRDLWRQKDCRVATDGVSATLPRHGVLLVRCYP